MTSISHLSIRHVFILLIVCAVSHGILRNLVDQLQYKPIPTDNLLYYDPVAKNILAGKGLTQTNGSSAIYYPPGYPLFLALVYRITGHAGLDNAYYPWIILAMQGFSCVLGFLWAKDIAGEGLGFLTGLLIGSYPFFVYLGVFPWITMPIFLFPFLAFLFFFSRGWLQGHTLSFAISAFCLGISSLIWPAVLYLPVVLSITVCVFHGNGSMSERLLWSLALMGTFLMTIAGWILWVRIKHGLWIPLATDGPMALLDGLVHLKSYEVAQDAVIARGTLTTSWAIAEFWIQELIHKPWVTIKYIALKSLRAWYGTDSGLHESKILLLQIPYLLLALWGIKQSVLDARLKIILIPLLVVILYFWITTTIALSILRYMIPVMLILQLFVALALKNLYHRLANTFSLEIKP